MTEFAEISLSQHQILTAYHGLRLQSKGIVPCKPSVVRLLNDMSGKRFTAKRWLQIITPYYEQITTGFKPVPSLITNSTPQHQP